MAGKQDIVRRIKSVKNTRKITYAMKLVSAAKLKKAQESVANSREFTDSLYRLLALLSDQSEGSDRIHPLMERRDVSRIRLVVVGGSRGLAGGYNSNLNKRIDGFLAEIRASQPSTQIDVVIAGKKPGEYFRRLGRSYVKSYEALLEEVFSWPIEEIASELETAFLDHEIDEVYVAYTKFRSAISVTPKVDRILPLKADLAREGDSFITHGKVLFEPSTEEVFSAVVPRVFRSILRQACLEAKASEHGSRMTAMDSATKNAGELVEKLTLHYNKLRQAGITSELLDIIGGAEAIQ